MFLVAILIEAIRSNCGGEWAKGRRLFLYSVIIRLRYSRSTPCPFPSYSSAFFQFYLFISGWGLSRIVRFRVFILRIGCAVRGHCVLVVQPVCTSDVCHHFLYGAFFSLSVCMQGSRSLFGLSSIAVISMSTVITRWRSVQVVKLTGFASSSWRVRSRLHWWVGSCCSPPISSGEFEVFRWTAGKFLKPDHAIRSGGQP